ncbi:efflux RND transporter periplasmic adaptor subunit [Fodinisporobacter ferrooxydans]|uniref:Efflux RND transporter periplasmic adaptor subunit n=1 Tax=Fodinisporobacter ferrooxydans TaxID=2901836 RepID=A0ABY4CRD4_9BACL|nr:efflux RND transporter periplasmic adaptor subunit [Alicyclobacillaceae bacterium MYW30-H2]
MKQAGLILGLMIPFLLAGCQQKQVSTVYSGTIEGTEMPIQSELPGTIQTMIVNEGAFVKASQPLAKLDDRSYRIGVEAAKAAVDAAQAQLDDKKAGARTEEIRQALANVETAQAMREASQNQVHVSDDQVQMLAANKQALESKWDGANKTLQYQQDRLQRMVSLHKQNVVSQQEVDTVQEAVNQAQTEVDNLHAQIQALDVQITQSQHAVQSDIDNEKSANANVQAAQAKLDLLKAGSTEHVLQGLLANVEQANSQLDLAELNESKTTILAPADGIILRKDVENREVVQPGATLYTLLESGHLKVVVYVPEAQLNLVKVGESASISVDAYPSQMFQGKVTRISSTAEFTPKNVQTPDERTKMVFAVTIQLTNGLDRLKPGMPADVRFVGTKAGGK